MPTFAIARVTLRWIGGLILLSMTHCASAPSPVHVLLKSNPPGAEVSTLKGDLLGVTPLELTPEMLTRAVEDKRLAVTFRAPGYWDRQLAVDLHDESSFEVILTPQSVEFFQKRVVLDFAQPVNQLVRELLIIQGLLATKNLTEAESLLAQFQQKYPPVAASYVMSARLEEMRGNHEKARELLKKAWGLDNQDPFILRLLGMGGK